MSSSDKGADKGADKNSSSSQDDSKKKIADLEKKLAELQKKLDESQAVTKPNADSGAVVSATDGKSWRGGSKFEGGPQHYAMANDAFKWAVEMKDRGDDRPFSLIFDQLYMEQRRTVGVADKKAPPGGYNSSKLMNDVYAKAKELKEKGDDRSTSMIIASLSFAYRRGQINW